MVNYIIGTMITSHYTEINNVKSFHENGNIIQAYEGFVLNPSQSRHYKNKIIHNCFL